MLSVMSQIEEEFSLEIKDKLERDMYDIIIKSILVATPQLQHLFKAA
jgi:hypothetical protein